LRRFLSAFERISIRDLYHASTKRFADVETSQHLRILRKPEEP
jgi:hypothetical protein